MKTLELIAPRIEAAHLDVVELLKPLPKPKPVIHIVTPPCNPVLVVGCSKPEPKHEIRVEYE